MAKHKLSYALPVAVMAMGAFAAMPTAVMATASNPTNISNYNDLIECVKTENAVCMLSDKIIATDVLKVTAKGVTLNLNKQELTTNGAEELDLIKVDGGDLTITGEGYMTSKRLVATVDNGTLTIENGFLTSTGYYSIYGLNGANIYIKGGILKSGGYGAVSSNNTTGDMNVYISGGKLVNTDRASSIYMPTQANLQISGGEFYGSVVVRMGKVDISGGKFYASGNYDSPTGYLDYSGSAWLPSALSLWVNAKDYTSENKRGTQLDVNITGGEFISEYASTEYGAFGNSNDKFTNAVAIYDAGTNPAEQVQTVNVTISDGVFKAGQVDRIDRVPFKVYSREDITGEKGTSSAAKTISITGGTYSTKPMAEYLPKGMEAEESNGVYTIVPKEIDYQGETKGSDAAKAEERGETAIEGSVEFVGNTEEIDRNGYFIITDHGTNGLTPKATSSDSKLVAAFDLNMYDRNDNIVKVSDSEMKVKIALTEEQYNELKQYDSVVAVYFDENGNETEERIAAELVADENSNYYVVFTVTHFSTYGIIGMNEETATATTPETGTMTAAGASAANAGILAVATAAVISAIVGIAAIIRRK